jgi:hypothetical protein
LFLEDEDGESAKGPNNNPNLQIEGFLGRGSEFASRALKKQISFCPLRITPTYYLKHCAGGAI